MMNEWDRDNLDFIMNSDHEDFEAWLYQASDEDVEYALKLIRIAKSELIEEELDMMQPTEQDAIVAKNLIDRIKNGVKNS